MAFVALGFQYLNLILLLLSLSGAVLFFMVLFKLNKALDIWLRKNRNDKE